jgi:N-acyl-D-amino-acid deacylase
MKKEDFVAQLKSENFRNDLKHMINSGRFKFEMIHPLSDPYWFDCYRILTHKNKVYEGKTLGEIARKRAPDSLIRVVYKESFDALFDIIAEDPESTWALILDKRELPGALPVFFSHKAGMPCTDTSSMPLKLEGSDKPGPSAFGLFALYIDTYVKQRKSMSLEEAVKHASYIPAQDVLGLKDRGVLSQNAYADIVVFDLGKIRMAGDYITPNVPPDGIEYVLVNGKIVWKQKAHTGVKSGKVLRHKIS